MDDIINYLEFKLKSSEKFSYFLETFFNKLKDTTEDPEIDKIIKVKVKKLCRNVENLKLLNNLEDAHQKKIYLKKVLAQAKKRNKDKNDTIQIYHKILADPDYLEELEIKKNKYFLQAKPFLK